MARYNDEPTVFGSILKFLVLIVILGLLGLVAFAYVGDLGIEQRSLSIPVPVSQ